MKLSFYRSMLFTAILLAATIGVWAQGSVVPETVAATKVAAGKMFDGEKLTFEGKASKLKLSIAIADLTFSSAVTPKGDQLSIRSIAESKGTMLKLFRYSFMQDYESVVDLSNFRITKTAKKDVQKQRVRDSVADFDYQMKRVSYVETDPKDSNRPPRRIASEITDPMNDMISAIYAIRLRDLAVGDKFEISVSDSGLVYKVPVAVTKREQLGTAVGKFWCLKVEPAIFGPGRLIEQKGNMIVWLTDDKLHTPVKAAVDTQYGKVEIKIKSMTKPT
ncbi:MAG: DUF3108 domain-containing protein [Pyrinomonadaceae bacterium]